MSNNLTAQYVIVNRVRLTAGILVGISGRYDYVPSAEILQRAVELIFRNNPTVYSRDQIATPDQSVRSLIVDALTRYITVNGEISDDPDDINSAASAVATALGVDVSRTDGEVTA